MQTLVLTEATFASFGSDIETIVVDFKLHGTDSPSIAAQAKVIRCLDESGPPIYGLVRDPWLDDERVAHEIRKFAIVTDNLRPPSAHKVRHRVAVQLDGRTSSCDPESATTTTIANRASASASA